MTGSSKSARPADPPLRGEAAWRAAKEAIAKRNDEASRRAQARRQAEYDQQTARLAAADKQERAKLAKRRP
jgi:hypothetical protein